MRRHNRWLALFVATRLIATGVGVALLLLHTIPPHHRLVAMIAVAYGAGTVVAAVRWEALQRKPLAWGLDAVAVLVLILATEQWQSPFYVLGLTALVLPATGLALRPALAFGGAYTAGYFAVAVATGIDWDLVRQTSRLESLSTHLMVPMVTVIALAYAAGVLRRLQDERERSERFAVEAERRRIAWELHDSAKQRVHAAHLMLSQHQRRERGDGRASMLDQALSELRAAATDIETSLTELRTPLEGRGLAEGLRKRADELSRASGLRIEVEGTTPELPTTVAAHVFRVVGEAMTNAVRHSQAERVQVRLAARDGWLESEVSDDGQGLPSELRPGSNGIRSMRARAGMLGGRLEIASGGDRSGTTVRLEVPLDGGRMAPGEASPASERTDTPPNLGGSPAAARPAGGEEPQGAELGR